MNSFELFLMVIGYFLFIIFSPVLTLICCEVLYFYPLTKKQNETAMKILTVAFSWSASIILMASNPSHAKTQRCPAFSSSRANSFLFGRESSTTKQLCPILLICSEFRMLVSVATGCSIWRRYGGFVAIGYMYNGSSMMTVHPRLGPSENILMVPP